MKEIIGFGMPTTCGYSITMGSECEVSHFQSYYVQNCFAVPIQNNSVHHQYAWSFPHCTALPIGILNEKIITENCSDPKKDINLVAWGSSGGYTYMKLRRKNGSKSKSK